MSGRPVGFLRIETAQFEKVKAALSEAVQWLSTEDGVRIVAPPVTSDALDIATSAALLYVTGDMVAPKNVAFMVGFHVGPNGEKR